MGESSNRQRDVFLAALDLASRDARAAFLAQACEADDAMRSRIEAMLKAHDEPDGFLDRPAVMLDQTVDQESAQMTAAAESREGPGTRIGPYKLVEQIGEGGMGVVYMAQQLEPIRRMVALKIIKPGMDSGQVLARFEAERQALAVMDHPNIARVFDAGATADRRPFFVMELVKGTPITEFCDQRRLSPRRRLELFVTVCQAIQHAHQKGVIHRDIKPSNVLVALYDDKPVPKVIDFGVAKAAGQPLTNMTLHTGFGALVGTPQYMSPEQATFNQLDIDTRSDVYSLGVLLYELLTGATPVDKARLKEAAVLEVLRVVREEEPPPPSVRLSTTAGRAGIAATRGTDSGRLTQLLRGELDWIVMKALEKERQRRYETAAGLARDVDRYLNDDLVEARPPSAGYRLRKFIRRNRGKVAAAALVLLALIGGVIGTTVGMLRAHVAEHHATDAFRSADANKTIAETLRDKALTALHEAGISEQHAKAQALEANTARHALLMAQAMRCWVDHNVGEATQYLDSIPPPFDTTWEARFLRSRCRQKFAPFPMSEDGSLAWLAPSPNGRWLVAWTHYTDQPETVHLVDAGTGKTKFRFFVPCHGIAFSHDGKWVVVAGNSIDNGRHLVKTKTFDLETGGERSPLDDVAGDVFDVAVSPDDTRIALACLDRVVIRDAGNGKVLQTLAQSGEIRRLAFSPGRKRLAAYSFVRYGAIATAKIWDLESGQEAFSRQIDMQMHSLGLQTMDLSADGSQLALSFDYVAGLDRQNEANDRGLKTVPETVELWDTTTGKTRWSVDTVKGQLVGVAFSPDGRHVACTGTDSVFVLDAGTGKLEKSFRAEGSHGYSGTPLYAAGLNYLPDGGHVVTSTGIWNLDDVAAETLTLQDLSQGRPPDPGAENGIMGAAAFSADGKRLVTCAGTLLQDVGHVEELVGWDAKTGRQDLPVMRLKRDQVQSLAYSLSGQRLVLGCSDGHLAVCDTDTGKELVSITGPAGQPYQSVAINADGSWIASSDHQQIILWGTADGARRKTLAGHKSDVGRIAISSDGTLIAAAVSAFAAERSQICIWDVTTGRLLRNCEVPGSQEITCLGFSPDGRRLVAGHSGAGALTMWDTQTGDIVHVLKGHTSLVASIAFSPDGHRLASGSFDQTIRLWDVETAQEVLAIKIPGRGQSVAFSPDGKRLAASIGYKSVWVWEAP